MLCPKCKKELDDNVLKCDNCGTRVASVCKNCGTINPIRAVECSNCHQQLLKICTECGSANLPNAKSCRRCGVEFVTKTKSKAGTAQTSSMPEYYSDMKSQQKVKAMLLDAIKDADASIITLSGDSGSGKNLVLRYNEWYNRNIDCEEE